MKRALSPILALVICLSLCACGGNTQESHNSNESTENNTDNAQDRIDAEYITMVCGRWDLISGWRDLGFVLEFRESGICVINEEALTWDAAFKDKQWLDAPKEFVNIYRNNELAYEAYIDIASDGSIMLTISERDDSGLGIVPAGSYKKLGDSDNPMARVSLQ